RCIGFGFGCRQLDDDLRAAFGPISGDDVSTVVFDDAVAGAEAESGAVAHRLGGVKGIEDARQVFDAWPAVAEFQYDVAVFGTSAGADGAAAGAFKRVHAVVQDVHANFQ